MSKKLIGSLLALIGGLALVGLLCSHKLKLKKKLYKWGRDAAIDEVIKPLWKRLVKIMIKKLATTL